MKRLILGILVGVFGLAAMDASAAAPLEWSLKASQESADTQGKFCAVEQTLENGPHITIARNLIGQYSLIAVTDESNFKVATSLPARIEIGKKFSRQIAAFAKDDKTIALPLGWDSGFVDALNSSDKLPVHIQVNQKSYHYFLNSGRTAMGQLASCANSLLAKNPTSLALPNDLRPIIDKAGLSEMRLVQFQDPRDKKEKDPNQRESWTWIYDDVFGGVDILTPKPDTKLEDIVLYYLDRLESLCRGQFTSDFSPPVQVRKTRTVSDAEASCHNAGSTSFSTLVFMQKGEKVNVFYTETDEANKDRANTQKKALMSAVRSGQ